MEEKSNPQRGSNRQLASNSSRLLVREAEVGASSPRLSPEACNPQPASSSSLLPRDSSSLRRRDNKSPQPRGSSNPRPRDNSSLAPGDSNSLPPRDNSKHRGSNSRPRKGSRNKPSGSSSSSSHSPPRKGRAEAVGAALAMAATLTPSSLRRPTRRSVRHLSSPSTH